MKQLLLEDDLELQILLGLIPEYWDYRRAPPFGCILSLILTPLVWHHLPGGPAVPILQ